MWWKVVKIGAIASGVIVMLAFIGLLVMVTRPALLVGVDGSALAYSIGDGEASSGDCNRSTGGDWRCHLLGGEVSGRFDVNVNWMGCWTATLDRASPGANPPGQLDGCIQLGDVITTESLSD